MMTRGPSSNSVSPHLEHRGSFLTVSTQVNVHLLAFFRAFDCIEGHEIWSKALDALSYLFGSIYLDQYVVVVCVLTMVLQDYTTENIEICKMISLFRLVSELCLILTPKMLKFQFISQKNMLSLKTELKRLVD